MSVYAQTIPNTDTIKTSLVSDSIAVALPDTLPPSTLPDSLLSTAPDSLLPGGINGRADSLLSTRPDSLLPGGISGLPDSLQPAPFSGPKTDLSKISVSKDSLDAPVEYNATDSMRYDIANERIFLYGDASVKYDGTSMTAGFIIFDKKNNIVEADGRAPENKVAKIQPPAFENGNQSFTAGRMRYNFDTGKGIIYQASTKQEMGPGNEMFVTSGKAKFTTADTSAHGADGKQEVIYSKDAIFSTCNHPHPHFGIRSKKQKVIPNKLIVVGPSNLEIGGIPTPVWLPFGAFPLGINAQTGLIFNNDFEVSEELGIGLKNIGWYFPLGEHMNLQLIGDIYTRGSWRVNAISAYKKRYKYNGNLRLEFNNIRTEDNRGQPIWARSMGIRWSHNQDRAAHPTNNFSGSVNFQTNNNQRRNRNDADAVFSSNLSSNVSFRKTFPGKPFDLSVSARHSQNTNSRTMTVELPNVNLRMKSINPFKARKPENRGSWYEKIQVSYNMAAISRFTGTDTTFFEDKTFNEAKIGVQHKANASAPFRLFKFFTVSPNASYTESWNFTTIRKQFFDQLEIEQDTLEGPSGETIFESDTTSYGIDSTLFVKGFEPWRNYRVALSVNTKIFGIKKFRKGMLRGLRHTISPSLSFGYTPDYSESDYLREYRLLDSQGELDTVRNKYNIFRQSAYSSAPTGQRAMSMSYTIGNNFEGKYWSKKDSTEKVFKFFDNININGSHNFILDSLKWSDIRVSGRTQIIKNLSSFNFNATYSLYDAVYDENGRPTAINTFYWDAKKRPIRFVSANFTLRNTLRFKQIRNLLSGNGLDGKKKGKDNKSTSSNTSSGRRPTPGSSGRPGSNSFGNQSAPQSLWDILDNFSINHNFTFQKRAIGSNQDTTIVTAHSLQLRGNIRISEKWSIGLSQISYNFKQKQLVYPDFVFTRDLHCWEMSMSWQPARGTYFFTINVKPGSFLERISVPYRKNVQDGNAMF